MVAMYVQFRSYLHDIRLALLTDHKSLVWLHCFKDTEGIMSNWLPALQHITLPSYNARQKYQGNMAPSLKDLQSEDDTKITHSLILITLGRNSENCGITRTTYKWI